MDNWRAWFAWGIVAVMVTIGAYGTAQYIGGQFTDKTTKYCEQAVSGEWYCSDTPIIRK